MPQVKKACGIIFDHICSHEGSFESFENLFREQMESMFDRLSMSVKEEIIKVTYSSFFDVNAPTRERSVEDLYGSLEALYDAAHKARLIEVRGKLAERIPSKEVAA